MLLGSTASGDQTPGLVRLLADRSPDVRSAAARALGKAGDATAAPDLLTALTAARPLPSGIVGMALLDLGTDALPVLRENLTTGTPAAAALAASLLGLHGDLAAAPALTAVVRDPGRTPEVRRAAAEALGRIGAPQASDALTSALAFDPEPPLRQAAAEALGRIGDPAAVPTLVACLATDDLMVRTACGDALTAIGPEGREWLERLAAGEGLGAVAARGALDVLAVRPRRLQAVPAR
jgi:HEAT repeat protein